MIKSYTYLCVRLKVLPSVGLLPIPLQAGFGLGNIISSEVADQIFETLARTLRNDAKGEQHEQATERRI